jgi:hypothetical protein
MTAEQSPKGLVLALTMAVRAEENRVDQAWEDYDAAPESEEDEALERIRLAQVKLNDAIARRDKAVAEASGASHLKVVPRV